MLVQCPHCQKVYSHSENFCTNCGKPASSAKPKKSSSDAFMGPAQDMDEGPIFYPVTTKKLVLMELATAGFYSMFYCFQTWNYIQKHRQQKLLPAARGFFQVLYIYPMFKEMRAIAGELGSNQTFPAGVQATIFIVLSLCSRLPDPYWLVTLFAIFPMIAANNYVGNLNKEFGRSQYIVSKMSILNWVGVGTLGLLCVLGVIVTMFNIKS